MSDGDYYARVSFGIQNSAMPTWGEFLPENKRWDVIKFIQASFQEGTVDLGSLYSSGLVANNMATVSPSDWTGNGNVISADNGKTVYQAYCQTCHGEQGGGDGPGAIKLPSGAPGAFSQNMIPSYIFWRTWEGVPDTIMPPFNWMLSEGDIWDVITYVQQITSGGGK
jgi:mono/diheme cytochrome c family protein